MDNSIEGMGGTVMIRLIKSATHIFIVLWTILMVFIALDFALTAREESAHIIGVNLFGMWVIYKLFLQ